MKTVLNAAFHVAIEVACRRLLCCKLCMYLLMQNSVILV